MIKDQNKRIRDFYLKELKILNENDKKKLASKNTSD